jgi:hypothetical protein
MGSDTDAPRSPQAAFAASIARSRVIRGPGRRRRRSTPHLGRMAGRMTSAHLVTAEGGLCARDSFEGPFQTPVATQPAWVHTGPCGGEILSSAVSPRRPRSAAVPPGNVAPGDFYRRLQSLAGRCLPSVYAHLPRRHQQTDWVGRGCSKRGCLHTTCGIGGNPDPETLPKSPSRAL